VTDNRLLRTATIKIVYCWALTFLIALSAVSLDTATALAVFIGGAFISLLAYSMGMEDQRNATKRQEGKVDESS
jgi:hypothetical protein